MARLVPIEKPEPVELEIMSQEQQVAEICARLADGETLNSICRSPHLPRHSVVWQWCQKSAALKERVAAARARGYDVIAEEAVAIADGMLPVAGTRETVGEPATRDKLRVDTRLKLLAKWDPKRYGEATQIKIADADGNKLDARPAITELLAVLKPPAAAGDES